jgi:hypothetical protein
MQLSLALLYFSFLCSILFSSPSHIHTNKNVKKHTHICRVCIVIFTFSHRGGWKENIPNWMVLNFWYRSFTFNSNKSATWCNNFPVYYPDVCLQLNMFRAFSRPSSGAQWLQWQPLILPSYRGDSRAVFVVGQTRRLQLQSLSSW